MKRIPLFLLLFSFLGSTSADLTLAKQVVEELYTGFNTIAVDPEGNDALDAVFHCLTLFASDHIAKFPDESTYLENSGSISTATNIFADKYVSGFRSIVRARPGFFQYTIAGASSYYEAEWRKSESRASFVYCFVDKSYAGISFRDTVLLNGGGKIVGIRNCAGGEAYTADVANSNSIEGLTVSASKFYSEKKYSEAFSVYSKILEKEPANVNANYRLAVMSYKREGCKQFSKKETDRMAMKYLRKARSSAEKAQDFENVKKFDNILYYWH